MKNLTCFLMRLNKYRITEKSGTELSIFHRGKKIWPRSRFGKVLSPVTDLNLQVQVEHEKELELELFEHSLYFFRKRIGKFVFLVDGRGGPYNTDISNSEERYNLEWMVS